MDFAPHVARVSRQLNTPVFYQALASAMPGFLQQRRWFGGKSRRITATRILDIIPFAVAEVDAFFTVVRVEYASGPGETYSVPLILGSRAEVAPETASVGVRVGAESQPLLLYDAVANETFLNSLLRLFAGKQYLPGEKGGIRPVPTSALLSYWQPVQPLLPGKLVKGEQSNSSIIYGNKLILKLFRRLEEGINPDVEIGTFLTERAHFPHVPAVAGHMEYECKDREPSSFAILQAFVPNQGDAWRFTLEAVKQYYERAKQDPFELADVADLTVLTSIGQQVPLQAEQRVGSYMHWASLLGRRTAELHLALASVVDDPEFSPEPFSTADRNRFCNSALDLLARTFQLLREQSEALPNPIQAAAEKILQREPAVRQQFKSLLQADLTAKRTRIHGDYHLGQVLFTGDDFVIIDFEGEPARSLAERRGKRSPLQDVAGMLRSFHYAAYAPLIGEQPNGDSRCDLDIAARYWYASVAAAFMKAYFETSRGASYLPATNEESQKLLDAYVLEKAIYELGYELNNRPSWAGIPLQGITDLLGEVNTDD